MAKSEFFHADVAIRFNQLSGGDVFFLSDGNAHTRPFMKLHLPLSIQQTAVDLLDGRLLGISADVVVEPLSGNDRVALLGRR